MNPDPDRILVFKELKRAGVPFARQYLLKLEARGKFPKRVSLGDRRIGWVEQEVRDWVDQRIKARKHAAKT